VERAIIVDKVSKEFEFVQREKGFVDSLRSLISPVKKKVTAVSKVSFVIQRGELVGFIGPNGAGKTTTLKLLSGLLYPSSGFISVLNYDPWDRKEDFLKQISLVMGQKNQMWWDLPAINTFELNKRIYEIPKVDYEKTLKELVRLLNVEDLLTVPVRRLSLGQRMKMELIASLLHRPKMLFLDEPTIGLDVVAQKVLRDFIYEYNKKYGATILLTSHNMSDVSDLARRVIVIDKGKLIFDGALEKLIEDYAKEKIIKFTLSSEDDIKKLEGIGKIKKLDYPSVVLSVPRSVSSVAASEILQSFPVSDLTIEEMQIDEVIRRVFKKSK